MQKVIFKICQILLALHAAAIFFGLISLFIAFNQIAPQIRFDFTNVSKFEMYSHVLRLGLACGIAGVSGFFYVFIRITQRVLK